MEANYNYQNVYSISLEDPIVCYQLLQYVNKSRSKSNLKEWEQKWKYQVVYVYLSTSSSIFAAFSRELCPHWKRYFTIIVAIIFDWKQSKLKLENHSPEESPEFLKNIPERSERGLQV